VENFIKSIVLQFLTTAALSQAAAKRDEVAGKCPILQGDFKGAAGSLPESRSSRKNRGWRNSETAPMQTGKITPKISGPALLSNR
jgi:hypothetical protein